MGIQPTPVLRRTLRSGLSLPIFFYPYFFFFFCIPIVALFPIVGFAQDAGEPSRGEQKSAALSAGARQTESTEPDAAALEARKVEKAIQEGVRFLCGRQITTGSFSKEFPVAITALAGMALLGAGVEYNRGEFGTALSRATQYLASRSDAKTGYINDAGEGKESRMHGHSYAILFLAQVIGTIDHADTEAKVRRTIERGVQVIERGQTDRGGWGYEPRSLQDEASITVCALQALRAAKDAGFQVDTGRISGALRYLKACAKQDGSFMYSLSDNQTRSSYELTAAAVSTMHAAGEYTIEQHKKGIEFMRRELEHYKDRPLHASTTYPYYGSFYAGQVFYQLGGADWSDWYSKAREQLLSWQKPQDGSWTSDRFCSEYATAMALLILEIPQGLLPIFER